MTSGDNDPDHMPLLLPEEGAVAAALAETRAFCTRQGLCADTAARLAIVVEELVMNLVEHAERPPGDRIGLTILPAVDATWIAIEDGGVPFDPRAAAQTDELPPERGGGAGIRLVMAWARELVYCRHGGRNRLTLTVPFA